MVEPKIARRDLIVGAAALATCSGCSVADVVDEVVEEVVEDVVAGQPSEFGLPINLGPVDGVLQSIRENDGFWYRPDGRMWLTEYPADALDRARQVYSEPELVAMEAGFVVLFQKCTHLGCRVPSCVLSQWFECPCHGSKYNRVGEKRGGPAPRGMDRFAVEITAEGDVIVKTAEVIQGPAIGTNTTGQEAEGPNCIGEASH